MNFKRFISVNRWRTAIGYNTIGIFGIGIVVAKTMQDLLIKININIPFFLLFILGVAALWITGYLYVKIGMYSVETEYMTEQNTYFEKHLRGKKGGD